MAWLTPPYIRKWIGTSWEAQSDFRRCPVTFTEFLQLKCPMNSSHESADLEGIYEYHINHTVTYRHAARQRLGKSIPAATNTQATIYRKVFIQSSKLNPVITSHDHEYLTIYIRPRTTDASFPTNQSWSSTHAYCEPSEPWVAVFHLTALARGSMMSKLVSAATYLFSFQTKLLHRYLKFLSSFHF
jgi:hypothetical protein